MCSCWQENPDNRPTFETLYMRFDEFMIQAEPSYREVRPVGSATLIGLSLYFRRNALSTTRDLSDSTNYLSRSETSIAGLSLSLPHQRVCFLLLLLFLRYFVHMTHSYTSCVFRISLPADFLLIPTVNDIFLHSVYSQLNVFVCYCGSLFLLDFEQCMVVGRKAEKMTMCCSFLMIQ
jgi:hypothetical protein